ncbi:MAG: hypothetical protein N4A63_13795 [Vallitalea sp.]|jgi:hypothetical protein|nr:hypothetical protein [Vallitalea sp.]
MELNEHEEFVRLCIANHEQTIERSKNLIAKGLEALPQWCKCEYKIKDFLRKNAYTQSVRYIVNGYKEKYIEGYYISRTTEITVNNCFKECKYLHENGYLDAKD